MQSNIKKIISWAKDNKKDSQIFTDYVKIFYNQCFGKDFADYSTEELFNVVLASFQFFQNKPKNSFKLRLYNPSQKSDGFESKYTILDIVNDDMPFLVDSVVIQFDNLGIDIKNIIHPVLTSSRSKGGAIESFNHGVEKPNESVIQLHLAKISNSEIADLENHLSEILKTVRLAVDDWQAVVAVARKSADNFKNISFKNDDFDSAEVRNFIDWVVDNHFIFFGSIEFDIENNKGEYLYKEVAGSRLGVYKSEYKDTKPTIVNVSSVEIEDTVKKPYLIEILKSRYKSHIHRYSNAERIRIQKFDDNGKVVGEYRFVGLFTSSVYYQNSRLIPIIRKKIERVINDTSFDHSSSSFKDLISTLESYPRDELFQIEHKDLLRISTGIVAMSGRSVVRIFVRNDKFSRFVSCLIFVPRDRFSTDLRRKIQGLLSEIYSGEVSDAFVQIADSNLTRLHVIIRTDHDVDKIDVDDLEKKLITLCRLWIDDFEDEISANFENGEAKNMLNTYGNAFSVSYTNRFDAKATVLDIKHIGECLQSNSVVCDIYKTVFVAEDIVELKIYSPEKELLLSDIMPILDRFGFNVVHEHTYIVSPKGCKNVWIHYFHINLSKDKKDKLTDSIKTNFIDIVSKIISGETKVGYLNRLIVSADLTWREVDLIRAYDTYLYQIGFRFNQRYISDVLVKHRDLTKMLVELFETKFNPAIKGSRQELVDEIVTKITKGLNKISDVGEDSVVRKMLNIIQATVRTNFYQTTDDGKNKSYISFKLDSSQVLDLPLPVMYAEIFIYSAKFEGIHLRGGKVARGGIRWSDRQDDFRTEVLGLVKAQMTKNAVIVPVGSKGGFVVKKDTTGLNRDEFMAVGIDCYKNFLRGLLDLTDNIVDGKIIHPKNVIRYDDNDPYLVVAADKGTATFSDIANGISAEYNFWLGDAFASGGSVGYDHKKMGITAKGAWVSVKRHFNEIGVDIQKQDFTCTGIGDLSGDVFGNGMLLSHHIKLIAAFNHLHIFIDPDPDPAVSFKERQRMFNLPRSGWNDYDKSKISKGGGVFERSSKSIKLSSEAKKALAIESESLSPNELISAILKAPVDLLWNGGIGTYVKSSDENHLDVGDRINDDLRINGCDLKCKVVGEGGNLGFTQKGRIEAAFSGVRLNTDAMDNSAGVDCSDHEVNIKIALTTAVKSGKVSLEERNKVLEEMTDEVADLVLHDNKMQTAAVSAASTQGYLALGNQAQFLNRLEKSGLLNRKVEFLPSNKDITKRQSDKIGLTRPELCVLLAYSKMDLYPQILGSTLVKDPYLDPDLFNYFPKLLQNKFKDEIESHQLRSEIIATQLTNSIVNKAGITFVNQIASETGFPAVDVVRNFIIVCDAFSLDEIWDEIELLGNKISSEVQSQMFFTINKLLERGVVWLLRHQQKIDISVAVVKYGSIIKQLFEILDKILAAASQESFSKKINKYSQVKVPSELSKKIAAMDPLASAFDIAEIASQSDFNIKIIARIYFEVGTRFDLKWLRSKIAATKVDNYWQKLSFKTILEDLYNHQMNIAKHVVDYSCSKKDACPAEASLDFWIKHNELMVQRYDDFIVELKEQPNPDLSMFVVALNRIKALLV